MIFWIREIAGWFLVLVGLYLFAVCIDTLLNTNKILEMGPLTLIAIMVFRGGIHLLKVAVAARICLHSTAPAAAISGKQKLVSSKTPPTLNAARQVSR